MAVVVTCFLVTCFSRVTQAHLNWETSSKFPTVFLCSSSPLQVHLLTHSNTPWMKVKGSFSGRKWTSFNRLRMFFLLSPFNLLHWDQFNYHTKLKWWGDPLCCFTWIVFLSHSHMNLLYAAHSLVVKNTSSWLCEDTWVGGERESDGETSGRIHALFTSDELL